jgi:hypothetical protein
MPIPVATIQSRVAAALDSEGNDRYTFDQDYKHAINFAIEWIVLVINEALGQKKMTGEALRELVRVRIWQTNHFSRVAFDPSTIGDDLWSVLAVYPEPVVSPSGSPNTNPNPTQSIFMPGLSYVGGTKDAKRLTLEEWNENDLNVFAQGNMVLTTAMKEYGYLDFADYSSTNYSNPGKFDITIRPYVPDKFVAIAYMAYPKSVALTTDSVEMPMSMINMVVEKALNFISYKQGDQTNLFGVTEKDVTKLVSFIK